ncbi:MAG: hypothetical protein GWN07_41060, partial [Actinobacteria bacterium]|nr:hypothetical protein [Actinomycetota bacterium]
IFEDYGTRNFPELMALGDALDFQQGIGWDARTARLRELWDGFRDAMTRLSRVRWRSPTTWELGSSLFAIEVDGVG